MTCALAGLKAAGSLSKKLAKTISLVPFCEAEEVDAKTSASFIISIAINM